MADLNTFLSRFLYSRLPQFSNTGSVSGVITASTTSAGTIADTNETDLWTYSLPANTLDVNGRTLRVRAWFSTAATANNKTAKLYFGSTNVVQLGAVAGNNETWELQYDVIRTGAATEIVFAHSCRSGAYAVTTTSPTETLSGALTIKATGQNGTAAANDIVFKGAMVELLN